MAGPEGERTAQGSVAVANVAMVVMATTWGATFPLIQRLLETWDPLSATAGRQTVGMVTLLAILALRDRRFPIRRSYPWRRIWALGLFAMVPSTIITTIAVSTGGGAAVAMMSAASPLIAVLVARVCFRMALRPGVAVGTALSLTGGLLVVTSSAGIDGFGGGEALICLSSVLWSWYTIKAQVWLQGLTQLEIAGITLVPNAMILLAITLALGASGVVPLHVGLDWGSLGALAFMGILSIGLNNWLWHYGVSRLSVMVAALYMNLVPVAGVGLAFVLIGTVPTVQQVVGGAVILAGVVYAQLRGRRDRTA